MLNRAYTFSKYLYIKENSKLYTNIMFIHNRSNPIPTLQGKIIHNKSFE